MPESGTGNSPSPKSSRVNRREDCRYAIRKIALSEGWEMVEMSRTGARIFNPAGEFIDLPEPFTVRLGALELNARPVWNDTKFMGVALSPEIADVKMFMALALRPKAEVFPPQIQIPTEEFARCKAEDTICTLVNFMVELDSPSIDVNKLKYFIEQISELYGDDDEGPDEDVTEVEPQNAPEETPKGKTPQKSAGPPPSSRDLKGLLIERARGGDLETGTVEMNIDFAISRLGIEQLKSITKGFVKKKLAQVSSSMKSFKNYSSFTTLKTVLYNRISHVFGYQDPEGEGAALLQFETAGIEALINRSSGVLDGYYTSATRVYSNLSRRYERALFGKDLIEVNKAFFDKIGQYDEMYFGYVMAHLGLNPQYDLSKELKVTLSKEALNFSLVAHLTFLGLKFAMDRDRLCGSILIQKLMGRGMNAVKAGDFVNDCVNEANKVIDDFGMRGKIGVATPPPLVSTLTKYLPKDIRYRHIVNIFREFERLPRKRLAIRFEDSSYAHFILRRLINDPECQLSRRVACVIPCANISEKPLYMDNFSNFDLLVFKNIDKLPSNHVRDFMKIWSSYEGAVVVTFDKYSFIDYTLKPLFSILKESVVDFPSYFAGEDTYRAMVGHTIECLAPYLGGNAPEFTADGNPNGLFLDNIYSMEHIFAHTFLNKEIV